jgi:hypothetical protein
MQKTMIRHIIYLKYLFPKDRQRNIPSRTSMNSTEKGKIIDSAIKSLLTFATLEEGFFTADLAARRRIQGDNFICHRLEFVVYNLNELKNYKEIKIK